MSIFDDVNNGIREAMKAKDKVRLEALRGIKKVMLEAKTAVGASDELSDEDVIKMILKLAKQGKDSADIYTSQGRDDLAQVELAELAVFETFLPEMLSDDALDKALKLIIKQTGASGMKDMGKVMGVASKQLAGKADGKTISERVRSLLQ